MSEQHTVFPLNRVSAELTASPVGLDDLPADDSVPKAKGASAWPKLV